MIPRAGFIVAASVLVAACAESVDPVRTDSGLVRGVRERGVIAFKGIPFAAPPVGSRRWRAPQAPAPWKHVLEADAYRPQCMQVGPPLPTMPVEQVSEDCLYLNVWAPTGPTANGRPVMVWLHGGGFRQGSASTPLYRGHELARRHGVVVINLSYRLGPLGFLAHPELTAESGSRTSGNYGLLDMIAGLQWVRRNAAAFGGDASNVTVFGQSARAWALNKLMISPLARGLFHRAIGQSGGDMGPMDTREGMAVLADAETSGIAFANAVGATSIADLRRMPASRIAASGFEGLPGRPHSNVSLPVVDGYVIPGDAGELYAAGEQVRVPLLVGYNADEGAFGFEPSSVETYLASTRHQYGAFTDQVLELCPATPQGQSRLWAESAITWHVRAWAIAHARTAESKVFFYYFSARRGHGAELPYVFGYSDGIPRSTRHRTTADQLSAYWTNFARTGDPNGDGLPTWPLFDVERETVMQLGEWSAARAMPDVALHRLMDRHMASVRDSARQPAQAF